MTLAELEMTGAALYGPRWQTDLARALDVSDRSMRRWVAGQNAVPDGLRPVLARLVAERIEELRTVHARLTQAGPVETQPTLNAGS